MVNVRVKVLRYGLSHPSARWVPMLPPMRTSCSPGVSNVIDRASRMRSATGAGGSCGPVRGHDGLMTSQLEVFTTPGSLTYQFRHAPCASMPAGSTYSDRKSVV